MSSPKFKKNSEMRKQKHSKDLFSGRSDFEASPNCWQLEPKNISRVEELSGFLSLEPESKMAWQGNQLVRNCPKNSKIVLGDVSQQDQSIRENYLREKIELDQMGENFFGPGRNSGHRKFLRNLKRFHLM